MGIKNKVKCCLKDKSKEINHQTDALFFVTLVSYAVMMWSLFNVGNQWLMNLYFVSEVCDHWVGRTVLKLLLNSRTFKDTLSIVHCSLIIKPRQQPIIKHGLGFLADVRASLTFKGQLWFTLSQGEKGEQETKWLSGAF